MRRRTRGAIEVRLIHAIGYHGRWLSFIALLGDPYAEECRADRQRLATGQSVGESSRPSAAPRLASQAMLDDLASALDEFDLRPTSVSVLVLVAISPGITQSRTGQLTRSRADGRSDGLHFTGERRTELQNAMPC